MSFGAPQPGYKDAATAQADASTANVNAQTQANRPNLNTPWGSMSWTNDNGQWTGNVSLNPDQQAALESQQKLQTGRSQLANSLQGQMQDQMQTPMDWGALPALPDANAIRGQAVKATYDQQAQMLDPQWSQAQDKMRTQLLNEGLDPSSAAYQNQTQSFNNQKQQAYQGAMDSSIGSGAQAAQQAFSMGLGTRQQAISEDQTKRMQPLNEMNALMGGQQVSMPQFPGFSQAGQAQAPQYLSAAGMQGNFDLQNEQLTQSEWADAIQGFGSLAQNLFMF